LAHSTVCHAQFMFLGSFPGHFHLLSTIFLG